MVTLVLGATILAQYPLSSHDGALVGVAGIALAPLALYGVAAARWGAWTPGTDIDARIRAIRIASGWALLVGTYMVWSLPPLRTMTAEEWSAFARLSVMQIGAVAGIVLVRRHPAVVAYLLLPAAALGALMPIGFVRVLRESVVIALGPAMALSLLGAFSFSLALIAAFVLCWPLRKSGRAT